MEIDTKICYIYGLKDPQSGKIKYIGKTINPLKRYSEHTVNSKRNNTKMTKKKSWIKHLRTNLLKPELCILKICSLAKADESEIEFISRFNPCKNGTRGGDGGATMLGKIRPKEYRDKMSRIAKENNYGFSKENWNKSMGVMCKKVICFAGEKELGRYNSISQAARTFGISPASISYCLKKEKRTCCGLIWKFI